MSLKPNNCEEEGIALEMLFVYIIGFAMSVFTIAMGVRMGISPLVAAKPVPQGESIIVKLRDTGVLNKDEFSKVEKQYYWRLRQRDDLARMRAVLHELNELGLLNESELEEKQAFLNEYYGSK